MHVCSIFYLYLNIFFTTYLFKLTLKQLKRDMHWQRGQCGVWRFSQRLFNFFTKHHNLEEAGPESWRVRCMSTQLIDEGDLINEMNNEQKITATARQENG